MIAVAISLISFLTLLQFFVFYSRSLIAESRVHQLSAQALEICGLERKGLTDSQFQRLLQLISLCPDPGGDQLGVRTVALYFQLLSVAQALLSWAMPSAKPWIEAERGGCAYVAAVILDRRIAYNRTMVAQLASH
jgi:hypothetical protein